MFSRASIKKFILLSRYSNRYAFLCLPDVLLQVWDLSDQDNDSMLSLREFCIALYFMERYREGRPIPTTLPSNVIFDVSSFAQPTTNAGNAAWRPSGNDLTE